MREFQEEPNWDRLFKGLRHESQKENGVTETLRNIWSHPFAQKIRDGVGGVIRSCIENADPRNKNGAWRIGLAAGLAESAAFTFLAPIPGSGLIRGVVNMGITQGALLASQALNLNAEAHIKSFAKGMAAGGLYFSLPTGAVADLLKENLDQLSLPKVSVSLPEISLSERAEGVKEGVGGLFSKLGTFMHDSIETGLNKGEGLISHLPEATELSEPEAVAEPPAPTEAPAGSEIDLVQQPEPVTPLDKPEVLPPDNLVDIAPSALAEQALAAPPSFSAIVTQFVAENQGRSDLFIEHIVQRDETAGHLATKMGSVVRWDGSDALDFAILHKLNPNIFADLLTATPLTDEELEELIEEALKGDKEAYQELIKEMSLIRAGSPVKLLTPKGLLMFKAFEARN